MTATLETRFHALWHCMIGTDRSREGFGILDAANASSARIYHSWSHIAALLRELDKVRGIPEFAQVAFDEVELAIFFHDAIYVPGREDNESKSAALLLNLATGNSALGEDPLTLVVQLIEATAAHDPSHDMATRLMTDLDLSILGAPPDIYAAYVSGVRQEYRRFADDLWIRGRRAALDGFLARQRIYQTAHFYGLLEHAARANLMTERQQLSRI